MKKLVEEEDGLTESFKAKAAIVFEAEVRTKVDEIKENLAEEYELKLQTEAQAISDTLAEQVDSYLTYAVEEWMEENKVAIESSIRTEMAENFMQSLKDLFVEQYVEIPENKVDLFEQVEQEKIELSERLACAEKIVEELTEEVDTLTKEKIIEDVCEGLVTTQATKLGSLAEGVAFEGVEDYTSKLNTLKEFYFLKNDVEEEEILTEEVEEDSSYISTETIVEGEEDPTSTLPKTMQSYLSAISKLDRASHTNK